MALSREAHEYSQFVSYLRDQEHLSSFAARVMAAGEITFADIFQSDILDPSTFRERADQERTADARVTSPLVASEIQREQRRREQFAAYLTTNEHLSDSIARAFVAAYEDLTTLVPIQMPDSFQRNAVFARSFDHRTPFNVAIEEKMEVACLGDGAVDIAARVRESWA